ncbi:hypothetical protein L249_8623 [Ophiocordyceps polyrhachis-furcata BCC 54312]|uniref:Uncharacterized protein n=1 Tax=Ophiocordyceps polyrhachis-furcata BCC 54312 TaxID=1330021 RepID=A0A367L6Y2_9HYPO|nr:hypothetical protein L249_8623 [Ophiocordyceps polyrhachis-furcata BCC 54312]
MQAMSRGPASGFRACSQQTRPLNTQASRLRRRRPLGRDGRERLGGDGAVRPRDARFCSERLLRHASETGEALGMNLVRLRVRAGFAAVLAPLGPARQGCVPVSQIAQVRARLGVEE